MKLQGSEKQVAWAEDIIKAFKAKTQRELELLSKKRDKGLRSLTYEESNEESALSTLLGIEKIKDEVKYEARMAVRQAKENGEKYVKKGSYQRTQGKIINKAKSKFEKELKNDSASYWIDNYKSLTY